MHITFELVSQLFLIAGSIYAAYKVVTQPIKDCISLLTEAVNGLKQVTSAHSERLTRVESDIVLIKNKLNIKGE